MSRMNADEGLQERYLQVRHEKEKFKQRQEELETAYQDAEERRREQEDHIAKLERKLRDATKLAQLRDEEAETAMIVNKELESAQTQLSDVKRTLTEKDNQLLLTKQELRDQQEVFDQLELEREAAQGAGAAAGEALAEYDDADIDGNLDQDDEDGDGAMDPLMLLQQQDEIARLMDLLDEEAEKRRHAESIIAKRRLGGYSSGSDEDVDGGGSSELPGLPLDAEMEMSLADEMGGMSLADEMALRMSTPALRPPPAAVAIDRAALERLEQEKAEIQAMLVAERAKFLEEQAEARREQERLQMDTVERLAAEEVAAAARQEMEARMAEEKMRVQVELDAERARFIAEREQLQQQTVALEAAKQLAESKIQEEARSWEERERQLRKEHEAELELQQTLLMEMPSDDDDDEELPRPPSGPEEELPTLPTDAEGGEDEKMAYEVMAAEQAELLKTRQQLEADARLAHQLSSEGGSDAASDRRPAEPETANARLHRQFPGFEATAIDAILAANAGDVKATSAELRHSASAFGLPSPAAHASPAPKHAAAPSSQSYNPFGDPADAPSQPTAAAKPSRPSMSFEQRKAELLEKKLKREREEGQSKNALLAMKQRREMEALEQAKQKALLEKGRRFRAEQAELYRLAQEAQARRRSQQAAARRRAEEEAAAQRRMSQHTRQSLPQRQQASAEFKVVLPSQEKLYEALLQDDEYGAAQRIGLGKTFDGRVSIKCTPAAVHLIPNIKRSHKSHVHARAWEWRLHEVASVGLVDNTLDLSVWGPGSSSTAETYKFKIKHRKAAVEVHATITRFIKEASEKEQGLKRSKSGRKSASLRNLDEEFMRELRLNNEFIQIMSEETGISARDLAESRHFQQQFERMGPRSHKKLLSLRKQQPKSKKLVDPALEREVARARKSTRRESKPKRDRPGTGASAARSPDYAEVGPEPEQPQGDAPMLPPRPDVVDTRRQAWGEPDDFPLEHKPI